MKVLFLKEGHFKPYCVFADVDRLSRHLEGMPSNSFEIIEMPVVTHFLLFLSISRVYRKHIKDLKSRGVLDSYTLVSDLVVRKYDDSFSSTYGGGRFHQDFHFYRTWKAVSVWSLIEGNMASQRLDFILDSVLSTFLPVEDGVEIEKQITDGYSFITLPPSSTTFPPPPPPRPMKNVS
jgi:hypothetical protein